MPSAGDLLLSRVLHPGLSAGSPLPPARTINRWRPLRTARFRWGVDQTWTRPGAHVPMGSIRRPTRGYLVVDDHGVAGRSGAPSRTFRWGRPKRQAERLDRATRQTTANVAHHVLEDGTEETGHHLAPRPHGEWILKARPILLRPLACKASLGRILTCEDRERRRSWRPWDCPWVSACDRSRLL